MWQVGRAIIQSNLGLQLIIYLSVINLKIVHENFHETKLSYSNCLLCMTDSPKPKDIQFPIKQIFMWLWLFDLFLGLLINEHILKFDKLELTNCHNNQDK